MYNHPPEGGVLTIKQWDTGLFKQSTLAIYVEKLLKMVVSYGT